MRENTWGMFYKAKTSIPTSNEPYWLSSVLCKTIHWPC